MAWSSLRLTTTHYECSRSWFRLTIRDKIIPHAVSWFTGEVAQEDEFDDINDDGDDEEEEDDDDDDEDEDEDEDEDDIEDAVLVKVNKKVSCNWSSVFLYLWSPYLTYNYSLYLPS